MKKTLLLALFTIFAFGALRAATFSGRVHNVTVCGPLVNLKIYLRDSLHTYTDSTLTNSSGDFSFTLPSSLATGNALMIRIPAPCYDYNYVYNYTGANINLGTIITCGNPSYLGGRIMVGSNPDMGPTKIYRIRRQVNFPTAGDTTLTAVDSLSMTQANNGFYLFGYACPQPDTFLIKAVLQPGNANYSNYLPTYVGDSLRWNYARVIGPGGYHAPNQIPYSVNMIAGQNPGGPGFIGGSVLQGANKTAGVGDPLPQRPILLTNASGNAVAYTYSDAAGKFSFPSLAYGSYRIFGDALGKSNPALSLTLSAAAPAYRNVVFTENSSSFTGAVINVGVPQNPALAGVTAYPNPAGAHLSLKGLAAIGGAKTAILSDVTGAIVSRTAIAAGSEARIETADLAAGIYLLRVETEAGTAVFRIAH